MGAWGHGNFENDDAADWLLQLEESEGLDVVASALEAVGGDDYLEAPECTVGLAAAEVVAALIGYPAQALPEEVASWLVGRSIEPDDPLVNEARDAVARIGGDSELSELWQETDDYDDWKAVLSDLTERLGGD